MINTPISNSEIWFILFLKQDFQGFQLYQPVSCVSKIMGSGEPNHFHTQYVALLHLLPQL